jgi:hypothetical protein
METGFALQELIDKVKGKLQADNVDINDYDACIKCLEQTVSPSLCIRIYNEFINY